MRTALSRVALFAAASLISACGNATAPSPSTAPAGSPVVAVATPTAPAVLATPMATSLAGTDAMAIPLPGDAAPIDVAYAFDSIWVAAHHQNKVYRIDPATLEIVDEVEVGNGPGWFAVTDDAIWVTHQLGRGLARIDPATNTVVTRVGQYSTCGSPIIALGKIWQMACDAHQLMRVDPGTNAELDLTVTDYQWPAFVDGQIVMAGETGMARIDPDTGAATPIPGAPGGLLAGFDEHTVWLSDEQVVRRVDPTAGTVLATMPITFGGMVRSYGDHAWMIQEATAAMRIDTATNQVTKTVPVLYGPVVGIEAAGYLWVTAFGANTLWRIDL